MDSLVVYATWAGVILCGLALLAIALFGLKSMLHGKVSIFTASIVLLPVVLLVVLGLITGDWAVAGIWTIVIMFVLAALSLFLSGIRGLFS
jgi:hypothetical protein